MFLGDLSGRESRATFSGRNVSWEGCGALLGNENGQKCCPRVAANDDDRERGEWGCRSSRNGFFGGITEEISVYCESHVFLWVSSRLECLTCGRVPGGIAGHFDKQTRYTLTMETSEKTRPPGGRPATKLPLTKRPSVRRILFDLLCQTPNGTILVGMQKTLRSDQRDRLLFTAQG